jgi:predicted enzyme related to lactoylglutathione lyase
MLTNFPLRFTIPVTDMQRAQRFYEDTLQFPPAQHGAGGLMYTCNGGYFVLVNTGSSGTVQHSIMTWLVDDIAATVTALQRSGVVFEAYDFPGVKTVNSIATLGADQVAWFKDSEGNLLALAQLGK